MLSQLNACLQIILIEAATFSLVSVIFSLFWPYPNVMDSKSSTRRDSLERSILAPGILQVCSVHLSHQYLILPILEYLQ